jgi:hypothetical protein
VAITAGVEDGATAWEAFEISEYGEE